MPLNETDVTGGTSGESSVPLTTAPAPAHGGVERSGALSGENAGALSSSGMAATSTVPEPTAQVRAAPKSRPEPAKAVATTWLLRSCHDSLQRALEYADDHVAKVNALEDFRDCLERLWPQRGYREESFGKLINLVRILLLEVDVDDIRESQLEGLASVFGSLSASGRITKATLQELSGRLAKGGFNILRGLA